MKAFTLIEVVVVLSIFVFIFGTALYFLIIARDSLAITDSQVSIQQDLRRCLRKMVRELSQASINDLKDQSGQPLNLVERDELSGTLKCLPAGEECVYYTVKFKAPLSWDSSGTISAWSGDITYRLAAGSIIREESGNEEVLVSNIKLLQKESSGSYSNDPNFLGSGFERLGANRLKISLVAEREDYRRRSARGEIGSVVYLRN